MNRNQRKHPGISWGLTPMYPDGDYAHLRRTALLEEELKLAAGALLPFNITEGCRLHYEIMQYTIIN